MICGLENTTCEGRLKDMWLYRLEKTAVGGKAQETVSL